METDHFPEEGEMTVPFDQYTHSTFASKGLKVVDIEVENVSDEDSQRLLPVEKGNQWR